MKLTAAAYAALLTLVASHATAQTHGSEHDAHGAFGAVNFPVSCNPEAQKRFNTAAALLYSFYWEKVDSAVTAVLQADPTCAMAYWAKAIASLDNPLGSPPSPQQEQQGWAAVGKAKQLGGGTPRERDYIAAVETVFKDHATVPFKTRAAAYEKALEQTLHALSGGSRSSRSLCLLAAGHRRPQRPDACETAAERAHPGEGG